MIELPNVVKIYAMAHMVLTYLSIGATFPYSPELMVACGIELCTMTTTTRGRLHAVSVVAKAKATFTSLLSLLDNCDCWESPSGGLEVKTCLIDAVACNLCIIHAVQAITMINDTSDNARLTTILNISSILAVSSQTTVVKRRVGGAVMLLPAGDWTKISIHSILCTTYTST